MLNVFNDIHAGAIRSAGTTPRSQWELRQWILDQFEMLLSNTGNEDVMILGDLFDTFSVPMADWYQVFKILDNWLESRTGNLYLVGGNHDYSRTSTTMSSFQLLCKVLEDRHGDTIRPVLAPGMTPYGYVIPHVANQELFDQALAAVPRCHTLFLHCNYDNNFAAQSDQSLNLSAAQAKAVDCEYIVIAHEHQTRVVGERIWIPGNQIPTSVADWLNTEAKRCVSVGMGGSPEFHTWMTPSGTFERVDWRDSELVSAKFIRIEGEATAEEASEVLEAVSRYRQQSDAFVVTNAVRIQSSEGAAEFASSLETIKAFDVLAALKEMLTVEEFNVVEKAMGL